MNLKIQDGMLKIQANRTELIRLANELLTRGDLPEHDFDPRDPCSPCYFTFNEPVEMMGPDGLTEVEGFAFIRQKEEPPRRSALERAPHEALDAG